MDWSYMFILSPSEHVDCSTNPCEHGARCTEAGAGPFHCFCSWPYYGQRCESKWHMIFRFIQFSLIKEVYIYASLTAIFCRSHSIQSISVLLPSWNDFCQMKIRQIFATSAPVLLAWQHQLAVEIQGTLLTAVKFVPQKGQYQNIKLFDFSRAKLKS